MNGFLIFQSDHSQHTSFKIINHTPESKTIVFLWLYLERVFDDLDTPFLRYGLFLNTSFSKYSVKP
jgi:hypothetical protein